MFLEALAEEGEGVGVRVCGGLGEFLEEEPDCEIDDLCIHN